MPLKETEGKLSRDEDYRRRILTAARTLFERNGIDSVNMYQIAQEAGIGQGTLYRRYEHPGEIYSDLIRTDLEQFIEEAESQLLTAPSGLTVIERLDALIVRAVDYIDDKAEFLSSINCMYASKKNQMPSKRPLLKRLHGLIEDLLNQAAQSGETEPHDAVLTANFLLAALSPEQYLNHRNAYGYGKERYLAGIRRLFIEGLRKRS